MHDLHFTREINHVQADRDAKAAYRLSSRVTDSDTFCEGSGPPQASAPTTMSSRYGSTSLLRRFRAPRASAPHDTPPRTAARTRPAGAPVAAVAGPIDIGPAPCGRSPGQRHAILGPDCECQIGMDRPARTRSSIGAHRWPWDHREGAAARGRPVRDGRRRVCRKTAFMLQGGTARHASGWYGTSCFGVVRHGGGHARRGRDHPSLPAGVHRAFRES